MSALTPAPTQEPAGQEQPPAAEPATPATQEQPPAPPVSQGAANEQPPEPPADGLPDDPAALKDMIRGLRRENASTRTGAKAKAAEEARASLIKDLSKALGLEQEQPDPEALTKQLTEAQGNAKQTALELAIFRTATTAGADPERLLDSRAFMAKASQVDPGDPAAVKALIDEAITTNPNLKSTQAGSTSGAEFIGNKTDKPLPTDPRELADKLVRRRL